MRIKGYAGWMGSVFSTKIFCTCFGSLSWDMRCLVWWSVWQGGRDRGFSDASILGIDRMVCSRSGFVWLAPLFPWSSVFAECHIWCLALGRPRWSWRGTWSKSNSNNFSNPL